MSPALIMAKKRRELRGQNENQREHHKDVISGYNNFTPLAVSFEPSSASSTSVALILTGVVSSDFASIVTSTSATMQNEAEPLKRGG